MFCQPYPSKNPVAARPVADQVLFKAARANETATDQNPLSPLRECLLRHVRVVHEVTLAEDFAQATLMAIFENPQPIQEQVALTTWATAVLKNQTADWHRSPHLRWRVHTSFRDNESTDDTAESFHNAPDMRLEPVPVREQLENRKAQRETMTATKACLGRLPDQTSKVFRCANGCGLDGPR